MGSTPIETSLKDTENLLSYGHVHAAMAEFGGAVSKALDDPSCGDDTWSKIKKVGRILQKKMGSQQNG